MDLTDYRKEIDEIDRALVSLFARRMEVCARIGDYKQAHNLPVLDSSREREKLDTLSAMAPAGLEDYTRRLYTSLFALSREYQTKRMTSTLRCGLLGEKLAHSYSPMLHALLGDYSYRLFEVPPEGLEDFLLHGDWDAVNVTIPYKKAVVPLCARLTPTAKLLGSVNTLVRSPDGTLTGGNTDYEGFAAMVRRSGFDPRGKQALVLGSGGAGVTVRAVLRSMGACVTVISRTGEDNYETLSRHRDAAVLVNTTPVGMYPDTGSSPVKLSALPRLEMVYDLIYNPARTALMLEARALHIPCMGGLYMLSAQARRSSEVFTGTSLPDSLTDACEHALRRRQENIILIGMPGCGKTTVGRILAEKTGRELADADEVLARKAGMSVPALLHTVGEEGFRAMETRVLAELGKRSGIVLATGGGCVTREENDPLLRQNGTLFLLRRDMEKLPLAGRPLSEGKGVCQLYAERKMQYARFADAEIDNNGTPEAAADAILEAWK